MAWLKYARELVGRKDNQISPFEKKLTAYLRDTSGLRYTEAVLQQTVSDVLELDVDLLEFVQRFIEDGETDGNGLHCDHYFTMKEYLEETGSTPVAAALLFQMYRSDPMETLKMLLRQDSIQADEATLLQKEQNME